MINVSVAVSIVCGATAMLITIGIGLASHQLDGSTLVLLWYIAAGFAVMASASLFMPVITRRVAGEDAKNYVRFGAVFLLQAALWIILALLGPPPVDSAALLDFPSNAALFCE